jgi:HAD superfamily hydrolase (TIGR01509 family)
VFSAIVFDFDGTLVDSAKSIFDEYTRVAGLLGIRSVSYREFAAQFGKPWEAALEGLWPGLDRGEFTRLYRREREKTPIVPGVREALEELSAGYRLSILTSRGSSSLHVILEAVGIDDGVFECVFSRDSLSVHKPDPGALLEAAGRMGLSVSDMLYVGDSVVDAECAKKAGVFFVGVLSGGTRESDFRALGVEHVLGSVASLPAFLRGNKI